MNRSVGTDGPIRINGLIASSANLRLLLAVLLLAPLAARAATGIQLPDSTFYPRLVRLHYGPAS